MRQLGRSANSMPDAISLEKPARNLASLVMNDGLRQLKSVLISQWQRKDVFEDLAKYGIRPLDRALFYGPPGNGKTMGAQVIAADLNCELYRVRCESLLESAFGGTPKNMADVLDWLSGQGKAVVLLDECETLFPNRSRSGMDSCSREITSTMQIFWQRLDRWESPQLFLLATNMVDRLDDALMSRIELQLEFGPPTPAESTQIVAYWEEALHEYGASDWGPKLKAAIEDGAAIESFRALWQLVATEVRSWVMDSTKRGTNES